MLVDHPTQARPLQRLRLRLHKTCRREVDGVPLGEDEVAVDSAVVRLLGLGILAADRLHVVEEAGDGAVAAAAEGGEAAKIRF